MLKVGESDIKTKYSNCNSFEVTTDLLNGDSIKVAITQLQVLTDLLNTDNLKLAITQLCNEPQV